MPGHGLVDDHYRRRIGTIVPGKGPAFEKRNAQRAKVFAIGDYERSELQLPGCRGYAFDGVGRLRQGTDRGQTARRAHRNHTRLARKPVYDRTVEGVDGSVRGILI